MLPRLLPSVMRTRKGINIWSLGCEKVYQVRSSYDLCELSNFSGNKTDILRPIEQLRRGELCSLHFRFVYSTSSSLSVPIVAKHITRLICIPLLFTWTLNAKRLRPFVSIDEVQRKLLGASGTDLEKKIYAMKLDQYIVQGVFFSLGFPLECPSTDKLI